ncbi:heme-binding domain-containing protein [Draconibacterium halophilum]|uniref:Heme-binding domain-containing protein n=1 Tax=Draconibacterium halophilum TaxID=2706887 RepID=A0A6C0RBR1_9BACT|nr:heme-binding domain-containing protein [Draconibacterium halophilum]QIA07894.1 heme-binding domain-containing protein [Draconibacterium halophilum]
MKKSLSLLAAAFFMLSLLAFGTDKPTKAKAMPDDVKAVIENSCFGCHNTDSKNEDGKKELDFKKLDSLSKIKMISTYKEIEEVLDENEMPPKSFWKDFLIRH